MLSTAAEFVALARLRALEPSLARPYRISVGDRWGIRLFVAPPLLLCAVLVVISGGVTLALIAGTLLASFALQHAHSWWAMRKGGKSGRSRLGDGSEGGDERQVQVQALGFQSSRSALARSSTKSESTEASYFSAQQAQAVET